MKKYVITVLCICTALVSQAQIPLTRFGAPATRKMVSEGGLFKEFHSIEKPGVVGPLPSLSSQITDFEGLPDGLSNLLGIDALNITRAERQILEEQGPIDWEIPDAYFHYNSNGANDFQREDLFSKGMSFLDELTYEINQPIQYEAPLRTPLGKLTKYKKLAKQVSQLQTEINNFLKSERSSLIRDEKLPPLYQKRHELVQQMKTELEKQINSAHLDIRGYYPAHDTVYLAKFDDMVKRLTAQAKRNAENEPSPLATLNPQERIEYATFRAHQIIDFQEGLRKYIRTMHPPVTSNMLRMDFVFSVYKWYYSTLAGHTIPVPEFYFKWQNRYKTICLPDDDPRLFALDFEKPGIGKHFKSSGWANRERKLLSLGSTTFARYAQTQEAPQAERSTAKEEPSQPVTQINLPSVNPSFEGFSPEEFAKLAESVIEETGPTIKEVAHAYIKGNIPFEDVIIALRHNYRKVFSDSLELLQKMYEELTSLTEKGTALHPAVANFQLGKILETQTALRVFAGRFLEPSQNVEMLVKLDNTLSWYRYIYARSAGIFATAPQKNRVYNPTHDVDNILGQWNSWYSNKKPMISKEELDLTHSGKQPDKVVDLPRANPSFEGLSPEEFAKMAENTIEKTKGYIENLSLDDYKVYEGFRDQYTQIYQDSFSLIKQMAQKTESLLAEGSALSPVAAEVQLGKILETQTALRTFVARILTSENADSMIHLDYILSHYGYLYATSAGIFATIPTKLSYPYYSDHINDTLNRWRTRLRNGNPMVSKKEVNPRRHSKQSEKED